MEYEARVLDTQGYYSLVRWEGRKFPGLLIQGDTLWTVLETLKEAESELKRGNAEDAAYAIQEAREKIQGMSISYEEMMSNVGLNLPYVKQADGLQ